jgi:hypothetical protein
MLLLKSKKIKQLFSCYSIMREMSRVWKETSPRKHPRSKAGINILMEETL